MLQKNTRSENGENLIDVLSANKAALLTPDWRSQEARREDSSQKTIPRNRSSIKNSPETVIQEV